MLCKPDLRRFPVNSNRLFDSVNVTRLSSLCLLAGLLGTQVHAQQVVVNIESVGLNQNQAEVNRALNDACTSINLTTTANSAQNDLLNSCSTLEPLADEDPQLADSLDQLAPEEAFAVSDSLTDATSLQIANVLSRIGVLQFELGGAGGADGHLQTPYGFSGVEAQGGGAASDDSDSNRLQFFTTGYVSGGSFDGEQLQQDVDFNLNSVSLGFDYRLNDKTAIGVGLGFLQSQSDFEELSAGSSSDSIDLTVFGTKVNRNGGYFDLALNFGTSSYELRRQISFDSSNPVIATAETDATTVSLTAGMGKDFDVGSWTMGPFARGSFTSASVDAYDESADSNLVGFGSTLHVDSLSIQSSTLSLGGQVSRAFGTSRAVLVPQLSLEFQFETQPDKGDVNAYFLADPEQNRLSVEGEERDTNYANLGIGTSAVFAGGRSAFAFFESRLLDDYVSQYWIRAGFRWEF